MYVCIFSQWLSTHHLLLMAVQSEYQNHEQKTDQLFQPQTVLLSLQDPESSGFVRPLVLSVKHDKPQFQLCESTSVCRVCLCVYVSIVCVHVHV